MKDLAQLSDPSISVGIALHVIIQAFKYQIYTQYVQSFSLF